MVHHFIELVGKGFADQLVGNQIGNRHVQGDQWLAEMLDVQVIDLFDESMGQVSLVQQAVEPDMAGHDRRRLEEILFGDFQHRFDLRLDARLLGDIVGGVQQVGDFVDVGGDKPRQDVAGVRLWQLDSPVQVW